jgi:hypothetical protein
MPMSSFSFDLPEDFADYTWEVEAKGWFAGARLTISGKEYQLIFYEPVRLAQTIEKVSLRNAECSLNPT